jgi:hypothetical protein
MRVVLMASTLTAVVHDEIFFGYLSANLLVHLYRYTHAIDK